MKTIIAVNGACGRMGQRIIQLAVEDKDLTVAAAVEDSRHPRIGQDIGEVAGVRRLNVPIAAELPLEGRIDAVIDFSVPEGTIKVVQMCVARRIPLVVATTGHTAEEKQVIQEAGHETAILWSPSMSLAMNVLMKLLGEAAKALAGRDFDVEIIERHHRFKKDSPSGTALKLAQIVQEGMAQTKLVHGREGLVGERPRHEIGMHAVRVGDNVGEHNVIFSTLGETLELSHRAHSRDCYVRGALQAAKFIAGKPAGWYSMADVLGL